MTAHAPLTRLQLAAGLALERDLAALRAAEVAMARTQAMIAALAVAPIEDVAPLSAARQFLTYEIWAAARHKELNILLARQMAEAAAARATAARALARKDVAARLTLRR